MKYKIGDKVRVKDNLEVGKMYFMSNMAEFDSVEREMLKFKGKEVTISSYTDSKKYCIKDTFKFIIFIKGGNSWK